MPRKKDPVEFARQKNAKVLRTAIRLKHSLLADAEINDELSKMEKQFDKAVAHGKPFVVDTASILKAVK